MGQESESITVGIISGWDGEERCAGAWGWWTLWLWHSGGILVKLLGDRFDPASRVSASRSRFHSRSRRHHEDADCFADAITELCHVGYPQNSPELRQELISEQFVRGQVHSSQFVPDTLPIDNRYWQSHIATYTSHAWMSPTSHGVWMTRRLSSPCVRVPEMTAFHLGPWRPSRGWQAASELYWTAPNGSQLWLFTPARELSVWHVRALLLIITLCLCARSYQIQYQTPSREITDCKLELYACVPGSI